LQAHQPDIGLFGHASEVERAIVMGERRVGDCPWQNRKNIAGRLRADVNNSQPTQMISKQETPAVVQPSAVMGVGINDPTELSGPKRIDYDSSAAVITFTREQLSVRRPRVRRERYTRTDRNRNSLGRLLTPRLARIEHDERPSRRSSGERLIGHDS